MKMQRALFVIFLAVASVARATDRAGTESVFVLGSGARALAMGRTGVALANDATRALLESRALGCLRSRAVALPNQALRGRCALPHRVHGLPDARVRDAGHRLPALGRLRHRTTRRPQPARGLFRQRRIEPLVRLRPRMGVRTGVGWRFATGATEHRRCERRRIRFRRGGGLRARDRDRPGASTELRREPAPRAAAELASRRGRCRRAAQLQIGRGLFGHPQRVAVRLVGATDLDLPDGAAPRFALAARSSTRACWPSAPASMPGTRRSASASAGTTSRSITRCAPTTSCRATTASLSPCGSASRWTHGANRSAPRASTTSPNASPPCYKSARRVSGRTR